MKYNDPAEIVGQVTRQLRALLKKRRIPQAELARRMGISAAGLAQTLRGRRNSSIATIARIADVLEARVYITVTEVSSETEPDES